ncbi:MAG: hypothetical protein O7F70_06810 [Gemmatimonadetes bacterium]|nr:hypothetical protein [Gemmatimonadota bacterium]
MALAPTTLSETLYLLELLRTLMLLILSSEFPDVGPTTTASWVESADPVIVQVVVVLPF